MKRLLLAAADRDLLEVYRQILGSRFGETVTAFDGTIVIALLETEPFDLVILDRELPRVEHRRLAARISEKKIPLIVLTAGPEGGEDREDEAGQAWLAYPFTPEEICETAARLLSEEKEEREETAGRMLREEPEAEAAGEKPETPEN